MLLPRKVRAMSTQASLKATRNRILAALSAEDVRLLQPHLVPVSLQLRQVLEAPNLPIEHAYFIEHGQLSGQELEQEQTRSRQGRVASGRALSNCRLHRHQPVAPGGAGRRLLQSARHGGAVDQGRQERHQVDAAVMLLLRRQRRPASASCAGLQSRQLHADAGSAGGGQAVVADEPAGRSSSRSAPRSCAMAATSSSRWPRSRCRRNCSRKSCG